VGLLQSQRSKREGRARKTLIHEVVTLDDDKSPVPSSSHHSSRRPSSGPYLARPNVDPEVLIMKTIKNSHTAAVLPLTERQDAIIQESVSYADVSSSSDQPPLTSPSIGSLSPVYVPAMSDSDCEIEMELADADTEFDLAGTLDCGDGGVQGLITEGMSAPGEGRKEINAPPLNSVDQKSFCYTSVGPDSIAPLMDVSFKIHASATPVLNSIVEDGAKDAGECGHSSLEVTIPLGDTEPQAEEVSSPLSSAVNSSVTSPGIGSANNDQTTDPLDDTEAQVEEITLPLSANEEFMACSNEKLATIPAANESETNFEFIHDERYHAGGIDSLSFPESPFDLAEGAAMWLEFSKIFRVLSGRHNNGCLVISQLRKILFLDGQTLYHQGNYGPPLPPKNILRSLYTKSSKGALILDLDRFDLFLGRFHVNIQVLFRQFPLLKATIREVAKEDICLARERILILMYSAYSSIYNKNTSSIPPNFPKSMGSFNYLSFTGFEKVIQPYITPSVSPSFPSRAQYEEWL